MKTRNLGFFCCRFKVFLEKGYSDDIIKKVASPSLALIDLGGVRPCS